MSGQMAAVSTQMWWVMYLDGQPMILVQAPSAQMAEDGFREMMLGHKLPKTIKTVTIFDAPVEDVVRVAVCAQMSMLTALAQALGARAPGRH